MVGARKRVLHILLNVARVVALLLILRVLAGIVYHYQWYFPADFANSDFLLGRQAFFHGSYRFAFYAHIVSGPFVLLIAIFLFALGRHNRFISAHRLLGKIQFVLIVLVLGPSGLIMATRTYTGPIAGTGFALLSIMTTISAFLAVHHVRQGNIIQHRRWATRLFLMLLSPIVLRVSSGVFITSDLESTLTYQLSAWGSWIVPLLAFEIWNHHQPMVKTNQPRRLHQTLTSVEPRETHS